MTKQLGMIALGLVLTLGTATASWAGNEAAAKQKTGSEAAPAGSNWSPPPQRARSLLRALSLGLPVGLWLSMIRNGSW